MRIFQDYYTVLLVTTTITLHYYSTYSHALKVDHNPNQNNSSSTNDNCCNQNNSSSSSKSRIENIFSASLNMVGGPVNGGTWFTQKTGLSKGQQTIILEAHRGGGEEQPQNELVGFRYANELGMDSVEFDVWLTSDNQLAIVHGPEHMSEEEMKTKHTPTYKELLDTQNPNIPLLEEVINECAANNVFMNIEIKPNNPDVADMVVAMLKEKNAMDKAVISSFQRDVLKRVIALGGLGIGALYNVRPSPDVDRLPPPADFATWIVEERAKYNATVHARDTVNLNIEKATQELFQEAHEKGLGAMIWFSMQADTQEHMDKAFSLLSNAAQGQRKVLCVNKLQDFQKGLARLAKEDCKL